MRIEGLSGLIEKLDTVEKMSDVSAAIRAAGLYLKGKISVYPSASPANQPGRWYRDPNGYAHPMGYYERGRGWWYPIMTPSAPGTKYRKAMGMTGAGAGRRSGVAYYKQDRHKRSETLGRRWTTAQPNPFMAVVGNNASYIRFVQGDKQAHFHARRGWKKALDIAKAEMRYILDEFVRKALLKVLSRKYSGKATTK
jgi:hypothetical protein